MYSMTALERNSSGRVKLLLTNGLFPRRGGPCSDSAISRVEVTEGILRELDFAGTGRLIKFDARSYRAKARVVGFSNFPYN